MSQISAEVINESVVRRWKRYPAYKDSGFELLREIPAKWQMTRLKYGYEICLGKMLQPQPSSPLDTLEAYLRSANIAWEGIDISNIKEMWFSPYEKSLYELKYGDLIISEGGDVGRSAIWKGELPKCYIQNAVHRVRNKEGYSNKFLYYWMFFLKAVGYIDLLCNKATIAHFTAEKVKEIPVTHPVFPEQKAIASFLDRETAKIDTLIAKKEQLIQLLQEKRTALISHAVTKGLNPDAPMKDSGFELLREIPAKWEMTRLKYGYKICLGKMLQPQPSSPLDTLEPYLRSANIAWEEIDVSNIKEMWFSPYEKSLYELKYGDLLISEGGDVGRSAIWMGELPKCYIQNAVHRVRNKEGYSNKFLYYWMFFLKAVGYIDLLCNKATIAHFTAEKVKEIPVTHPVFSEQQAIASFLDRETAKIDALIAKIRTGIEHLKEYRTALISSAVTGKIDVCEIANAS